MDYRIDARAGRPIQSSAAPILTSRVKLVHPSSAVIIAGLAAVCWLPVALSAYLLAS